ncbi:ABC transporter permease [Glycomyces tenuis]|uniref:ABC transporter permease n=1 Tax=Glycomyces tenuis TaxID=58116 RepID=UPI00041484EC|nr:ABC transporter permease subunit [Glycomyces tenuis]
MRLPSLLRRQGPGATVYTVLLGLFVLFPMVTLVVRAAVGGGFARLTTYPDIGKVVFNTVLLAVGSLVVAMVLGTLLAVSVTASPPHWQRLLGFIPTLPLIVPGVADTLGWIFLFSPRVGYVNSWLRSLPMFDHLKDGPVDIFTLPWIVALTGFSFTGFVYLYVSSSLREVGTELASAARVFGAGPIRTFLTVTLPLIWPSMVYAGGVVLLMGLGQFTNPLLLGSSNGIDVLTTVLFKLKSTYPVDYAFGAALSAPLVIAGFLVVWGQRLSIGAQGKYQVVTSKANHRTQGGSRMAAIPVLVFGALVVLPLIALVLVALSPYWSGQIDWGALSLDQVKSVFGDPRVAAALGVTVRAILITVAIVVPIGFVSAMIQRGFIRAGRGPRTMVDLLTTLPTAIMGFAMLFTYGNPPFAMYGTVGLFVITYVALMIPHAMRPQLTSMLSIGSEFNEAAAIAGASRARRLFTIELPLLRGGISVAITMVVILLFHEFSASLMVATAGTQTIGSLLYDYFSSGVYPQVAVIALLMVVVTLAGVALSGAIGTNRKGSKR